MLQDSGDVHKAEKCGQGQALVSPQSKTFFTIGALFIQRASAQTLIPFLELDLFPAFQRHSSVRTPTVHLNFSTWVFWCLWYLQGQGHWLFLSSIIHLTYEEQEDCDIKKKEKKPTEKKEERSQFLFQLPEKNTLLLDPCGYTQTQRECSLWTATAINLSPLIIPLLTHKSQSTKERVHSSHKAQHAPRREAQLREKRDKSCGSSFLNKQNAFHL